jgi:putative molybdopterin biosynthesis protein
MTLDLVAQHLARYDRRLVSANVGSQGGLVAIQRGEAHLAGSHLLDPESGEYNISAIHNYLDGIPIRLVGWVNREQGLMVVKGNPKGIKDLADLAREDVTFVNRQRGAGTRVLLDYHLQKLGISSKKIKGYDLEEYTHLAVAAAVASGRADCGLGVTAAAIALDLDFIPLFQERYDLVVPQEFAGSDLLQPFWNLMNQNSFQKEISALPGYDISPMGKVFLDERKV